MEHKCTQGFSWRTVETIVSYIVNYTIIDSLSYNFSLLKADKDEAELVQRVREEEEARGQLRVSVNWWSLPGILGFNSKTFNRDIKP